MSLYYPTWDGINEPSQGNIRQWLDNLYTKFMPIEQSRWNQSNIDTLFYAGEQSFVNKHFNFSPGVSFQQYYFNIVQQPVNMVTGYQRQHRKQIVYQAADGADPHTTDQYTRLIANCCQKEGIHEVFSQGCEMSAVCGFNLLQPYLDFTGDDPAQGNLKLKVWEYNSFLIDPYFRHADMSDCNFVWCQEYISKYEAERRFPDKIDQIRPMAGAPQRYGNFYFLPENYNMARTDLNVLSYVWYKWKKKKKRLYSRSRNQFFDYAGGDAQLEQILYHIDDMEEVEVETPCWKLCVVLNDIVMYQADNPLWDGPECPFIPIFWYYEPHINYYNLRTRSLVYAMRSPQFLYNYKIIQNNDIASATINAGWKRKVGAVANEDNLKKSGQGWDVLINPGFELTDCEKIIPSAVPESDLYLAEQMYKLMFQVSGIDLENWSGQQDKQISSLTMLLKQASNLMVFQKFFDQWDYSLKLLGERMLQIVLNMWNAEKVKLLIGEEPSPHFYSRVFAKYKTVVEEGLLTPTQRNLQAQQMIDINMAFGREILPPSMIIKDMNIQGKGEILKFLQDQEKANQQLSQEKEAIAHAFEDAKLKELYSKAAANLATARERQGRAEADIGLFEERLSEITHNNAMATKAKMEALEKLISVIGQYGEIEAMLKMAELDTVELGQRDKEHEARMDARKSALANEFKLSILGNNQLMGQTLEMPQQQM